MIDERIVPKSYLVQAPCQDCKGLGFHEHNVEGDAFDIVNCRECRGSGIISTWRHK